MKESVFYSIEKKINMAKESYNLISDAWLSSEEIKNRISSLISLAKEIKAKENELNKRERG